MFKINENIITIKKNHNNYYFTRFSTERDFCFHVSTKKTEIIDITTAICTSIISSRETCTKFYFNENGSLRLSIFNCERESLQFYKNRKIMHFINVTLIDF